MCIFFATAVVHAIWAAGTFCLENLVVQKLLIYTQFIVLQYKNKLMSLFYPPQASKRLPLSGAKILKIGVSVDLVS